VCKPLMCLKHGTCGTRCMVTTCKTTRHHNPEDHNQQ
jgi:hypothetical protein